MISTEHQQSTFIQIKEIFNKKIKEILTEPAINTYYTEFMTLCVFYKKVNDSNCKNIEILCKLLSDNDLTADIESINWDETDNQLSCFMSSFTNL